MNSSKKSKRLKYMKYTEQQKTAIIEELWATSHKKLDNFLKHWPISPEDRADIIQEAFARAFNKLESFRGSCKLESWLFQIAKNIYLNKIRYNHVQKRNYSQFDMKTYHKIQAHTGNPGRVLDPLIQAELEKIVESVIAFKFKKRPEWIQVMREIFINYSDLSHAELAETYGVNPASMRREKFQIRKRIAERLRALKVI